MRTGKKGIWIILLGSTTALLQCKDSGKAVKPDDENELITSVSLKFTDKTTNLVSIFSFKDPDGEGGKAPTKFDTISLKPNTAYTLDIELLDESKSPVLDITKEVAEESDEHLFIYTPSPATLLTYTYEDKDKNGIKIGLKGTVQTSVAGTGKLKVQLRHQPGSKDGTPSPGSNDVELEFPLKIK
jgi:hypothetical protein